MKNACERWRCDLQIKQATTMAVDGDVAYIENDFSVHSKAHVQWLALLTKVTSAKFIHLIIPPCVAR